MQPGSWGAGGAPPGQRPQLASRGRGPAALSLPAPHPPGLPSRPPSLPPPLPALPPHRPNPSPQPARAGGREEHAGGARHRQEDNLHHLPPQPARRGAHHLQRLAHPSVHRLHAGALGGAGAGQGGQAGRQRVQLLPMRPGVAARGWVYGAGWGLVAASLYELAAAESPSPTTHTLTLTLCCCCSSSPAR
jgi:hypothetical protein